MKTKPDAAMKALLKRAGSPDFATAAAAQAELAVALTLPLKKGIINGDTVTGIFEAEEFEPGAVIEYSLDFLSPGTEKDFVAYTIPNVGRIPERHVEGDYLTVPTYDVGSSIDWALKYARDARWDIIGRAMQVLEGSFVRKMNNDGWHVLLAAAKSRNLSVYDDAATAGLFTKRLVSLMKTIMRRNSGGNSTSVGRGKMTDLYMSPEAIEDIRSWDLTQVDDLTRREILNSGEGSPMARIFGVRIHDLDELGVGQEYQNYWDDTLVGTMPSDKVELVIGLDLSQNDSFVMPWREPVQVFEDMTFHRQRRQGFYSWASYGVAALSSQRVLAGAL